MVKRMRWIRLLLLAGLMLAAAEGAVWAGCGTCQVCRERTRITIAADYCGVANNENGSMCCSEFDSGIGTYCWESGDACYGIIVDDGGGGGSGGGGGGGSTCSYQEGWCPPECISCSGGSGSPPAV